MNKIVVVLLFIVMAGSLVGCAINQKSINDQEPVAGDQLYIAAHYKEKLAAMKLAEVAAMPYFHSPFIVVAEDEAGRQSAVIFHDDETTKSVQLPVTYESITRMVQQRGFDLSSEASRWNLHLFEINHKLYWEFEDGQEKLILDTAGQEVADPFHQDELNGTSS
ncbi:hypothetical protein [Paenibacillus sp. OV219]|uniref:hypothetical protein n=1 Tax=Paenibacillus sp. OV219 TaxID=1884377 RepID=UPI0008D4F0F6|nr:hypothetical protein [Paenibacillus sp. OV219]SEO98047.1 hypothetical protein SAMN05518847_113176 [Paenibacillus sp. OV219]